MKQFTLQDVKRHNNSDSLWVVIENGVYDLTQFLHEHPGGEEVLLDRAGGDATDCFISVGHSVEAKLKKELYKVGELRESDQLDFEKEDEDAYEKSLARRQKKSPVKDYLVPLAVILAAFYFYFF